LIKKLHIVSFDVPYPPNYGGAIDVFYKLKALHALGIKIYFHTFEYGRGEQEELNTYCEKISYYSRNSFIRSFFSTDPFVVKSRANEYLILNLNADNYPILFEGLHTTLPVMTKRLHQQKVFVRAHNIEHDFFNGLADSESSVFKRNFFKQEAKKLEKYEKVLRDVDGVFTISPFEQGYFQKKYGDKCQYVPAFHDHKTHTTHQNSSKNILYHGNLLVSENVRAALYLIDIYKESPYHFTIASNHHHNVISNEIERHTNISFYHLKKPEDLYKLFEEAQVNVLPTFQKTGIKLKLLNTLYQGKFIIANDFMVEDTGLESLCERANNKEEFLAKTEELLGKDFTSKMIQGRREILKSINPKKGAQKIVDIIFN
jgi:hypothetical protein